MASILMEQLEEPHTVMVVVEVEVILMEVLTAPFTCSLQSAKEKSRFFMQIKYLDQEEKCWQKTPMRAVE